MEDLAGIGGPLSVAVLALVTVTIAKRRLDRGETAVPVAADPDPDLRLIERVERPPELRVPVEEANVPRWLRPSLRAERSGAVRATPRILPAALLVPPPTRVPLAFGSLPEDPETRRIVRSDGVSLLDAPDEDRGHALAQLESGDEIEVLDEVGGWVNVFTPTGRAGWLPASSLGAPGAPDDRSDHGTAQDGTEAFDLASILAARSRRAAAAEPPAGAADRPRAAAKPAGRERTAPQENPAGSGPRRAAPRKRRVKPSAGAGEAAGQERAASDPPGPA